MGKLLTVVISVLGLGATVWNTLSVEKKSELLEETDAVVSGLEQALETRELYYRLAVQEFNFSTLHAATAFDIDRNEKLLGASVAPGATMMKQKADAGAPGGRQSVSMRDKVKQRRELLKARTRPTAARPPPKGGAPAPPAAAVRPTTSIRPSIFARIAGPKPPAPAPSPGAASGQPRRPPVKTSRKVVTAITDATTTARAAIRPHLSEERRQQLVTIRGFQIENLSRWRQYMHVASTGEPMSEAEVDAWEELLADTLIKAQERALDTFADQCAASVQGWEDGYEEGRIELAEEADKKAALGKQVDRGKSIYMGLMLVGLVLVTLKDVFGKSED